VPASDRWLYELLKPFELSDRVAAVMGSQVPRGHAFPLLKYEINGVFSGFGPGFGTTLFYDDDFIQDEGVRNAVTFYSDVNSAARRDVLTGPVPYRDVSYAEDQLFGRDVIAAGLIKAYAPRAAVVHSNDLTLAEYDERMAEETMGLREVGIDVAVPSVGVVARMVSRGVAKDSVRLFRDRDFSRRRKLWFLLVGPLYHLQKWRGVRRGARAPLPAPATPHGAAPTASPETSEGLRTTR
jgi:rhamnosyltransferase